MTSSSIRRASLLSIVVASIFLPATRGWAVEPHEEFLEGRKIEYSTAGDPKAKGLNITIEYPVSWRAKSGERPNIPQTFVSEGGKGLEMATILVRELPPGAPASESDVTELFTPHALREMMPEGATVLDAKSVKVDGLPGGWVRYEMQVNRVGVELLMICERYVTYFDRRLIDFQFQVGALAGDDQAQLAARYNSFAPLFRLMANSIIMHDRYPTSLAPSSTLAHGRGAEQISQADFAQYRDEEYRFSIHYPRSWARVDATHPQTRFKVVSDEGAGTDDLSVVVTTLPGSKSITPEEFLKSMNAEAYLAYMQQNVPGATLIEHGSTTLSNQAAYYFVADLTHRVLGLEAPMRQIQVQTVRNRHVYTITFRTDPDRLPERLKEFVLITVGFVLWPEPPGEGSIRSPAQSLDKDAPAAALPARPSLKGDSMTTSFPTILGFMIGVCLILIPLWRLFSRTGVNKAWLLALLVPVFGPILILLGLALSSWPNIESVPHLGKES